MYDRFKEKSFSKELNAGDIVYVIPTGNSMRYKEGSCWDNVEEVQIEKVGRKYIYLDGWRYTRKKFGLGHGNRDIIDISEYSAHYIVYLSQDDFYLARENSQLSKVPLEIKTLFHRFSIEDKRELKRIVDKYK